MQRKRNGSFLEHIFDTPYLQTNEWWSGIVESWSTKCRFDIFAIIVREYAQLVLPALPCYIFVWVIVIKSKMNINPHKIYIYTYMYRVNGLISWSARSFTDAIFCTYEQVSA